MIPKVVYYVWYGDRECPMKYVDIWKKKFPEYEYILVNNIPNEYVRKCVDNKRWANASNYMRNWVLYNNGGIYIDTDVEPIKDVSELFSDNAVVAWEDDRRVNNAVYISPKGHWLPRYMMDLIEFRYNDVFLRSDYTAPHLLTDIVIKHDPLDDTPVKGVTILPKETFYPYHYTKKFTPECIKPNTYCVHHWDFSWKDDISNNRVVQP